MIRIKGNYYDGQTSRQTEAVLTAYRDGVVEIGGRVSSPKCRLDQLKISDRVGNIPRGIYLPDGGKFETPDNDAVDSLLQQFNKNRGARFLYRLESTKRYILASLVIVVFVTWATVRFGIPSLASHIAYNLPASTSSYIASGALEILDQRFFKPSELDAATQRRLQKRFKTMLNSIEDQGFRFELKFRKGGWIGANAFALPSGEIVMTDELVKLSGNDNELVAILAHEIGHVIHRHSLRNVIQSSVFAMIVIAITGDVSTSSTLVAALPTMLVEARYSQAFEKEADAYSLSYLKKNNIRPVHFKNIMLRLERYQKEVQRDRRQGSEHETRDRQSAEDDSWVGYFSSHPPTRERIKAFEE